MLIFLMYMFAVLGVGLLLAAAVLQYKLSYPPAGGETPGLTFGALSLGFPQQFVTPDQSHIIALDEAKQTLAIGRCAPGQEEATPVLYAFDAILGSEIVENALTLTKVSKASRISSSAIRPAAGIGISLKAGSTAADAETGQGEVVKELTLKIYLSSDETPVLSIPFLPGLTPAKKSDLQYSQAFSEAQHVHEKLREIVSASA
ncbi:hypothetical protein D3C73_894020 [compost metagenome]